MKIYNNYIKYCSLFLILCFNIAHSQKSSAPSTLVLSGVIYDQYPAFNPNFEGKMGDLTKGIVKSTLNSTKRVPDLTDSSPSATVNVNGRIERPDLYQYFFSPNNNPSSAGYNIPIPISLVLNYDSSKGVYVYDNQTFFPIDYKGFDTDPSKRIYKDDSNQYHNYHFTLKINSKFTYQGYETFSFNGDDDFYAFIDNKLVVDLGGKHPSASASINLSTLGLVKGNTYNIDFFYCERHTTRSTIRIETNIEISCHYYDYCGVCDGDGSTCCNPLVDCNDNNPCTDDACSPGQVSKYCEHTPKAVPPNSLCFSYSCNKTNGNIESTPIECPDKSSVCLSNVGCNLQTGCGYKSICTDVCHLSGACNNGTCVYKTSSDCVKELEPTGKMDPCYEYSCGTYGCTKSQISIDDGNNCTIDSCDPDTGIITHTPIKCSGCASCDSKTGTCILNHSLCDDKDLCTTDKCSPDGTCVHIDECKLNNVNPCLIPACNSSIGECIYIEIPRDKCDCGCNITNKCWKSNCTFDGKCSPVLREEIDDKNPCTDDICDPCTGIITHTIATKCLNCNQCSNSTTTIA